MSRTVTWSAVALQELEDEVNYLKEQDSLQAAEALYERAFSATDRLGEFPEMGPILRQLQHRSLVLSPRYRLVYRVSADTVFIVAFLNTRRDLNRAWKSRPRQ